MPSLLDDIERVPLDTIETHPQNPRRGDLPAIIESLRINSQYEPIVVQASTGYVLAGNHRLLAARELGWDEIDIVRVDVDDEHAVRIMLSSNRTADLGGYDNEALAQQLRALRELGTLEGTGYNDANADELLAQLRRIAQPPPPPVEGDGTKREHRDPGIKELVLNFSTAQLAQVEIWMAMVAKERGTAGTSETVYAALEIAARTVNG